MEYLDYHHQSSHNLNMKRRGSFIDMPPQKRMRSTQFEPVDPAIKPINQASMSFGSNNDYKPYSVTVQQYQVAAIFPVRSYSVPCTPSHVPNGVLLAPCMPSHNPHGALPLQTTVFPPPSSQATSNQQIVGTSHSDLISSLLSKGLISLPNQPPSQISISQSNTVSSLLNSLISTAKEQISQDSIGLEFDHAKLKIRHESAIRALYDDLPKQCTSCGMRFKSQEEHRLHMDLHIKNNLAALRNKHKPKQMNSRKFFLTSDLWLTAAEAIGPDQVPVFFTSNDVKEEKKLEKEVLADEEQKVCPLCMESFDEYFSNETNDWMYRGTVYFKMAKESTRKLHRSLEGRIVHAKCIQ